MDTVALALAASAYKASGAGSGGTRFVVTFTWNESADKYTCDKTYAQIGAAFDAGQLVLFKDASTGVQGIAVDGRGQTDTKMRATLLEETTSVNSEILAIQSFALSSENVVSDNYHSITLS